MFLTQYDYDKSVCEMIFFEINLQQIMRKYFVIIGRIRYDMVTNVRIESYK